MSASSFQVTAPGRAAVSGALTFLTVRDLLEASAAHITSGEASSIDLAQVQHVDSAGLALLIEWQSLATAGQQRVRFENVPAKILQLAHLSEVEELLTGDVGASP